MSEHLTRKMSKHPLVVNLVSVILGAVVGAVFGYFGTVRLSIDEIREEIVAIKTKLETYAEIYARIKDLKDLEGYAKTIEGKTLANVKKVNDVEENLSIMFSNLWELQGKSHKHEE